MDVFWTDGEVEVERNAILGMLVWLVAANMATDGRTRKSERIKKI